jgi:hypothetical protein
MELAQDGVDISGAELVRIGTKYSGTSMSRTSRETKKIFEL